MANSEAREVFGRGIVRGVAQGEVLVCKEAISFLGDLDIRSGRIVGNLPSAQGKSVKGRVLVFPATIGSAGAWRFLYQLFKHGAAPAALVTREPPDPSVVQGAILAGIPIICEVAEPIEQLLRDGDLVEVDGGRGVLLVAASAAPGRGSRA
ncbi:MAG: DUF126 domain-containing protein [Alphaproteobacteria bacterium]|nr:DUF126 domain-containing protein [Alphaproteobacteria bacterium]